MKSRKAIKSILLVAAMFLCTSLLTGCLSRLTYHHKKSEIFQCVSENKEKLAADIAAKEYANALSLGVVVAVNSSDQCVIYDCGGQGIAPSSTSFGFYYSYNDEPHVVTETSYYYYGLGLNSEGKGYSANIDHNYYYTEKICENFWYFEWQY